MTADGSRRHPEACHPRDPIHIQAMRGIGLEYAKIAVLERHHLNAVGGQNKLPIRSVIKDRHLPRIRRMVVIIGGDTGHRAVFVLKNYPLCGIGFRVGVLDSDPSGGIGIPPDVNWVIRRQNPESRIPLSIYKNLIGSAGP